jgi:hypothetical protein
MPSGKDGGKWAHFDKITEIQGDFLEKIANCHELIFLSIDGLKRNG